MSGSESPGTFEWFASLGNLLTIIISGSAVIGAIYTLIRYLRQNVTKGITDMKVELTREVSGMRGDIIKDIGFIRDKIEDQEKSTVEQITHNTQRIEEIKTLIAMVEKRIEDTKNDTNKRIDIRMSEIGRLSDKLDELRDEQNRLNVEIARKIDVEAEATTRHRIEDKATRQSERYVDRMKAANIHDNANIELERAMETIRKRLGQAEEEQEEDRVHAKSNRMKQQLDDRNERVDERKYYKEEDRLTRVGERGSDRSDFKEQDRLTRIGERGLDRTEYKEEDRLTRVDERGDDRAEFKEEDRLTRVDERGDDRAEFKEEDRLTRQDERGADRKKHKETDRLTRQDELKDERDIRHTDEQRREMYEGDAGKVQRTPVEEREDPESTHQEKEQEQQEKKREVKKNRND